jgi:lysophospholipase L1-like esterase
MKKILLNVIVLFISAGLIFAGIELFFRLNPKFNYRFNSLKFKHDKVSFLNNDDFTFIRPSALLGYEIIPNKHWPVFSNSYGLIGKEYKLSKGRNIFRILLLGDSIIYKDEIRQYLDEKLNTNPALTLNSKYKFEIWNAGCPGYDVRQYYLYLKHRGINYKPDMVLICFCLNDFDLNLNIYYKDKKGATEYYFPVPEISKRISVNPFLMKYSYFYRFVILMFDSYLSAKKLDNNDVLRENGEYYLQKIKDICTINNIPLVAVIFPYLKPLSAYDIYQQRQYQTIGGVVNELGLNSINLYDHLAGLNLYNLRENKDDDIHPNLEGHCLIGRIIYDYFLDNFLSSKEWSLINKRNRKELPI